MLKTWLGVEQAKGACAAATISLHQAVLSCAVRQASGDKQGSASLLQLLCIAFIPTVLAVAFGLMAGCLDLPLGALSHPAVETWRADLLTLLQVRDFLHPSHIFRGVPYCVGCSTQVVTSAATV